MRAVAFIAGNTLAFAASLFLARLLAPAATGLAFALTTAVMFAVVVCLLLQGLAAVGLLQPLACLIALVLLVAVTAVAARRWGGGAVRDDWLASRQRRARTFTQAAMIPAWFAFATVFMNVAAGALLGGVSYGFDDLYYHAVPVADWITSGRLFTSPALGVHGFFPKGAELLTLWFVLPFHQDAYASLAATYWLIVVLLATFVLVGRTRGNAPFALAAGALLVASALSGEPVHSFSGVDLVGPAATLAAIALTLPWRGNGRGDRPVQPPDPYPERRALVVGLAAGLAMAARPQFVVTVLACAIALAWPPRVTPPGAPRRLQWRLGALVIAGAFITGAYWYLRNILLTGNPLYPMSFGPLHGFVPKEEAAVSTLWARISADPLSRSLWQTLIWEHLRWPWPIGLMSAGGYAALLLTPWRRQRRDGSPRDLSADYLLGAVGIALFVLYVWLPFSGDHGGIGAPLRIALRYVAATFVIGVVLMARFAAEPGGGSRRMELVSAAGLIAVTSAGYISAAVIVVGIGAAAIVWGLAVWQPRLLFSPTGVRPPVAPAAVAMLSIALAAWFPIKQRKTDEAVFTYSAQQGPIGRAWQKLESLTDGTRIAWFGHYPGDGQYYPLYGRRLQLRPVVLAADATAYSLTKEVPSIRAGQRQLTGPLSAQAFMDNLRAQHVEAVLVSKYWKLFADYRVDPSPPWPAQMALLEEAAADGQAVAVWRDDYSALWRVQPRAEQPTTRAEQPDPR